MPWNCCHRGKNCRHPYQSPQKLPASLPVTAKTAGNPPGHHEICQQTRQSPVTTRSAGRLSPPSAIPVAGLVVAGQYSVFSLPYGILREITFYLVRTIRLYVIGYQIRSRNEKRRLLEFQMKLPEFLLPGSRSCRVVPRSTA